MTVWRFDCECCLHSRLVTWYPSSPVSPSFPCLPWNTNQIQIVTARRINNSNKYNTQILINNCLIAGWSNQFKLILIIGPCFREWASWFLFLSYQWALVALLTLLSFHPRFPRQTLEEKRNAHMSKISLGSCQTDSRLWDGFDLQKVHDNLSHHLHLVLPEI